MQTISRKSRPLCHDIHVSRVKFAPNEGPDGCFNRHQLVNIETEVPRGLTTNGSFLSDGVLRCSLILGQRIEPIAAQF